MSSDKVNIFPILILICTYLYIVYNAKNTMLLCTINHLWKKIRHTNVKKEKDIIDNLPENNELLDYLDQNPEIIDFCLNEAKGLMDEISDSINNLRNKAFLIFQYLFIIVSGFIGFFLSKYLAGSIMLNLSTTQAVVIIVCVMYLILIMLYIMMCCVFPETVRSKCRAPRYTIPLDTNYNGINEIKIIEIIATQNSIDVNNKILEQLTARLKYTSIEILLILFIAMLSLIIF